MRQVCKKIGIALAGIALLLGCKGDGTLLDLYPMEPIVNPEVGVLIQDNRIVHARLDGRQRISGITENGVFSTANKFQSFDFESHPWQVRQEPVGFDEGMIVYARNDGQSFSLRSSTDNGKTWVVYGKPILDESDRAAGSISVVQLLIAVDRSVWLLCQQQIGPERWILLYRVDLAAASSQKLLSMAHATAVTADFLDGENGWLLYAEQGDPKRRIHVLKTTDGGHAWSEAAVLDGLDHPAIEPVDAATLLVYDTAGKVFHSTDGGASFALVTVGEGEIGLCQAASDRVIYALLAGGVAKSSDGGQTWMVLNAEAHGVDVSGSAMYFYNEQQGIVYTDDKLFLTEDGGQSWDILVYPYDYVFK